MYSALVDMSGYLLIMGSQKCLSTSLLHTGQSKSPWSDCISPDGMPWPSLSDLSDVLQPFD